MLDQTVESLQATITQQQQQIETLTAQLKDQGAQIQKASAQLQMRKPTTKVVVNKP
jgi:multidrug resistance efflux pump